MNATASHHVNSGLIQLQSAPFPLLWPSNGQPVCPADTLVVPLAKTLRNILPLTIRRHAN